jgi:hypothetical protein
MQLSYGESAQTVPLAWDGSSRAVTFYYNLDCFTRNSDSAILKVFVSPDGANWEKALVKTGSQMTPGQYQAATVQLPAAVSAAEPQFAVKWEYQFAAAFVECLNLLLDDIALPAVLPSSTANTDKTESTSKQNKNPNQGDGNKASHSASTIVRNASAESQRQPVPTWAYIVVTVAVVVAIIGGGTYFIVRRRNRHVSEQFIVNSGPAAVHYPPLPPPPQAYEYGHYATNLQTGETLMGPYGVVTK